MNLLPKDDKKLIYLVQLFFLLPYFFDFVVLIFSTISFFVDGNNNQSSTTTSSSASSSTLSLSSFFLEEKKKANEAFKQRWYYSQNLQYCKLAYFGIIGALFFGFYEWSKTNDPYRVGKFFQSFLPDCKFWIFYSLLKPALDLIPHIIDPSISEKNLEEKDNSAWPLYGLVVSVLLFYSTYLYMRNSWSSLKGQFIQLYRNKSGQFESSRLGGFLIRIFGILVIEIIIAIVAHKLLSLIFPSQGANGETTENQEKVVSDLKKNWILGTIITVIVAPVLEELVYRRITLRMSNFSWIAVFTSSFIFAILHMSVMKETIFHLLIYFLGGVTFACTYKYFRNIWASITLHALHNLFVLISIATKSFGAGV